MKSINAVIILSLSLVSCGGGGGGSNNTGNQTNNVNENLPVNNNVTFDVPISDSNALDISSISMLFSRQWQGIGESQTNTYVSKSRSMRSLARSVVTESCLYGGSKTVEDTGTTYSVTDNNCEFAPGFMNIGSFTLSNIEGSLTTNTKACPGTYSFSINYGPWKTQFPGGGSLGFAGGYSMDLTYDVDPGSSDCSKINFVTSGTSFSNLENDVAWSTIRNFSSTIKSVDTNNDYSVSFTGTLEFPEERFSIYVDTISPLIVNNFDSPSSGTIKIENNSGPEILTVTINSSDVNDPNAVTLSLDSDGDGVADSGYPKNYSLSDVVPE